MIPDRSIAHPGMQQPDVCRRLSASGEVRTRQRGKGGRRFVSLSSYLKAVRKHLG
jgi:hypothetical protein